MYEGASNVGESSSDVETSVSIDGGGLGALEISTVGVGGFLRL